MASKTARQIIALLAEGPNGGTMRRSPGQDGSRVETRPARTRLHTASRAVRVAAAVAIALALGTVVPDAAHAASRSRYTSARKVGRGFANTTLGFLAIPGQMTAQTRERGWATGLPIGFGMGIGWFVASELIGVWEILTCPFEVPAGFKPILEPEFPWQYFEE
jgi:putative exosortase-associated protein (TIGR04073 family)